MILSRICLRVIQKIHYLFNTIKYIAEKEGKADLQVFIKEKSRLPRYVIKDLSRSVKVNSKFLAGTRIEFETEKKSLRIQVFYSYRSILSHMPTTGTSGIDVYVKTDNGYTWKKCISPQNELQMYCEGRVFFEDGRKTLCIYYPSFAVIKHILVDDKDIKLITNKNNDIVMYGSSITHGCAATRPGLVISNLLQRIMGCNVLNFGLSESAKGEISIIKYIAGLGAKIIILEYDHNATCNELKNSHLNVYKTIRKVTDCWIILMSRFSGGLSITEAEENERRNIIRDTYTFALTKGDKKISYIDGKLLFDENKCDYFVDGIHPNDLGIHYIVERIADEIKKRRMME